MVVSAYRHTYEQILETFGGKCKELLEKKLLLPEEDVVGIEPQDVLPCPRYSDMRDFMTKLRNTTIGSVYSRNEREKYVVKSVTPYILVQKCQNFAENHFLHFCSKALCILVSSTLNTASADSSETL